MQTNRRNNSGLGWTYTDEDNDRIHAMCVASVRYMRNYGKGKMPYMIDKSRYEPGVVLNEETGELEIIDLNDAKKSERKVRSKN